MRILIIRHGDPNYEIDGLTEKGQREVQLLAKRMVKEDIKAVYCSTLGRARLTAKPFLEQMKIQAEYCEWLREFNYEKATIADPETGEQTLCWDLMPDFVNTQSNIFHPTKWREERFVKESQMATEYDHVCCELDKILLNHGYRREGYNYLAENPNHDTIVMVCHFGLTAVLLSRLMNCSPYTIWQHAFTAPTAVTTVFTEERKNGIASFRVSCLGDVSHLTSNGEEPSFSGRFCECFTDDTQH